MAGGSAPELEMSKVLKRYAESMSGREQLAVKAFAEAFEVLTTTLSENAGLDPIDIFPICGQDMKKAKYGLE